MATIYLNATSGNDTTGNGTSGSPYKTTSKGNTVASSGDTLYLQNAVDAYDWYYYTKSLTIQGQSTAGVTVNMPLANAWTPAYTITYQSVTMVWRQYYFAPVNNSVFSLINCVIKGIGANGFIDFGSSITHTTNIIGCLFRDIVFFSGGVGIFMALSTSGYSCIANICNNTFYLDGTTPGNMFCLNPSSPGQPGEIITFKNNIIYLKPGGFGVGFVSPANATMIYNNNCCYGVSTPSSGSNNITSDPLFVDAANGNFNLRPTSPCIDAGTIV